jgi:CRISPR-associated protein Cas1
MGKAQLIIDSRGASLSKHNGLFEVRLQSQTTQTFHPDKLRSICLAAGVAVTTDALLLALEHDVEIIITDHRGNPQGRLWNNRFGSIATIRKKQYQFAQSKVAVYWVSSMISKKITNQLNFMYQLRYGVPHETHQTAKIDELLAQAQQHQTKWQGIAPNIADNPQWKDILRGVEGTMAKFYFQTLALSLPPSYYFEERSRPAQDRFNALLNYLYGILYARVETALVKAGIDASIGIFHADEYNKPVFTYDFIEPYRIWAEEVAFRLCLQQIPRHCFDYTKEGCWLNTTGKKTLVPAFETAWQEVIPYKNRTRSRQTHLQLDAHEFAQYLLSLP